MSTLFYKLVSLLHSFRGYLNRDVSPRVCPLGVYGLLMYTRVGLRSSPLLLLLTPFLLSLKS